MEITFVKENVTFTVKENGNIRIQAQNSNDLAAANILDAVKSASERLAHIKKQVEGQIQQTIDSLGPKK